MANDRKNLGKGSSDFDLFDLDDLDDDFGLGSSNSEGGGRIRRFAIEFKKGFINQAKQTHILQRALKGVLPEGYARAITGLESVHRATKDLSEEVKRTNSSEISELLRKAESVLPKLRNRTSEKLYGKIESRIKNAQEGLTGYNNEVRSAESYQRQADEDQLEETLAFTAGVQHDIAVAQEAAEDERFTTQRVEQGIRDKVTGLRFDVIAKQLGMVNDHLGRQVAYQDQITHTFQRKSLEVQYRSLFMLRDIRTLANASMEMNRQAYDLIIHNTALSDHQKQQHAMGDGFGTLKRSFSERVGSTARQSVTDFMGSYFPTIRDNLTRQITSGISQLGMVQSTAGMMGGEIDATEMAGGMAGGFAADAAPAGLDVLRRYAPGLARGMGNLAPRQMAWLTRQLTAAQNAAGRGAARYPGLGRMAQRAGAGFAEGNHQLNYLMKNMPAIIRDYTTDMNQSAGWRGQLQGLVRSMVPSFYQDDTLNEGTYQSIDRQTAFNQMTQRSIVDIIPGYLSRILQEARMLRTGRSDIDREVYDITTGSFTGYREARQRMQGRVISEIDRRNVQDQLGSILSRYDAEGQLSPEAQEALRERLLRDASRGGRFEARAYAQGGYAPETSDATVNELRQFFQGQFEFDEKGQLARSATNYQRQDEFADLFLQLQSAIPDPRAELRRILGTGSQELLRDLGLIQSTQGSDMIDYNTVWSLYRDGQGSGSARSAAMEGGAPSDIPVTDLYTDPHRENLVLKARDLVASKYRDVNTQKIVESFEDITGEVRDQLGRVVVRGEELAEGLYTDDGRQVFFKNLAARFRRAGRYARDAGIAGKAHLRGGMHWLGDQFKDITVRGRARAVLLMRDIKAGIYRDVNTGKPIHDTADITGEVKDQDDNTVLTEEEFQEGLYDVDGKKVKTGSSRLRRYIGIITTPVRSIGRFLGRAVKGLATGLWRGLTSNKDAYIGDEPDPRIRIHALRRGDTYFDKATGEPLRRFEDIKGAVVDSDRNTILSEEEVSQLVTVDRKPHPGMKRKGLIRRLAGAAAGGYWRMTKAYYRGVGRTAQRLFAKKSDRKNKWVGDESLEVNDESINTPTDSLLKRILSVLDRRLGPEEDRKGSWQDILKRRQGAEESEGEDGPTAGPGGRGPLASLIAGVRNLFGRGRQDDEEGGDGDTYIGGADFGGGDRKRKGGKRAPKGKMGRLWHGTKGLAKGAAKWGGALLTSPIGTLARGGLMGLAMFGKAVMATGAAIAGAVSLPVLLGGAVVAGAAVGGYMYYKKRQRASGVFRELRLTQYGVSPNGWSHPGKLLDLEALYTKAVVRTPGEVPTLDTNRMDFKAIMDTVGLSGEDDTHTQQFNDWMSNRFKPIFLAYQGALANIAPEVTLDQIDEKLPAELGLRLLELVRFPHEGETPYAITASPFEVGESLSITVRDIQRREQAVKEHYEKLTAGQVDAESTVSSVAVKASAAGVVGGAAVSALRSDTSPTRRGAQGLQTSRLGPVDLIAGTGSVINIVADRGTTSVDLFNRELSSLESIRLKAYGLERFTFQWVRNLFSLEEYLLRQVQTGRAGTVEYTGNTEDLVREFAGMLGFSDLHDEHTEQFRQWLRLRFIPVVVSYGSAIVQAVPTAPLTYTQARLERLMDPVAKVTIATAILGTQTTDHGQRVPIWGIGQNPFGKVLDLRALEDAARAHLKLLEEEASTHELKTTAARITHAVNQPPVNDEVGRSFKVRTLHQSSVQGPGGGQVRQNTAGTPLVTPRQRGGAAIALGNVYTGFSKGAGGVWESIPYPSANRSYEAAKPTLAAVSAMTGISAGLLATFASIESGFNYLIKAKETTATGWFQFINKTWDEMVGKFGKLYGILDDPDRALRTDPRVNALMGAEFLKANYGQLQRALGRAPTDTDLYLAHFLGANGAILFLRSATEAIAASVFPTPASKNKTIFYHAGGQPRTIGEVYRLMDEKVNRHRRGDEGMDPGSRAFADQDLLAVSEDDPNPDWGMGPGSAPEPIGEDESGPVRYDRPSIVNPFNQVGAPRPVTAPRGSGDDTGSSTANMDPVTVQREQAIRQASAVDRRQKQQVEQSMRTSKEIHSVLDKQLVVQEAMRDYLKEIAATFVGLGGEEGVNPRPNDTSRAAPTSRIHRPGSTPPPVSMRNR